MRSSELYLSKTYEEINSMVEKEIKKKKPIEEDGKEREAEGRSRKICGTQDREVEMCPVSASLLVSALLHSTHQIIISVSTHYINIILDISILLYNVK